MDTKYKTTYDAIMELPCVKSIIKKNKKLKKENKSLRNLIQSIPEFRQPIHRNKYNSDNIIDLTHEFDPNIIKNEPVDISVGTNSNTHTQTDYIDTSSVDVINDDVPPNIIYNIQENINEKNINDITERVKKISFSNDYLTEENMVGLYEEEEEVEESGEEEEEEEVEESGEEEEEEEVEESGEEEEEEEQLIKEDESRLHLFKRLEKEVEEEEVEESGEEEEEEEEVEESGEEEEEEEVEESGEEEEEEEEVEESGEEEEEEAEVFEYTINNKQYYITNEVNGVIYAIDDDEEVGDIIGKLNGGKPTFYKK